MPNHSPRSVQMNHKRPTGEPPQEQGTIRDAAYVEGYVSTEREPRVMITNYKVEGMTCGHCVSSVTQEVSTIAGVLNVNVDLTSGNVAVESREPLDVQDVAAAIEEAGYTLVG